MDRSKFLARVVGIYLILISIALLWNTQQFINSVNSFIHNPPLMFVAGFFTLIIGLLMVISHNIWQWNWRLIITIVGWITLIKGTSIILYPEFIDKITLLFVENINNAYLAAIIDLILGLILIYFGFRTRSKTP